MKHLKLIAILFFGAALLSSAQSYTPTAENLKAREEFRAQRFGVFIHWGIYSMLADGEWIMNVRNYKWDEYEKLASGFYPSKFNAAEWVAAIKASGAQYITITSRHHDGFSMFDTEQSDFDIVDATPFKRDIIAELAQECQKQGIKLHFYYSHLDWRRPDYPLGRTGHGTGRDLKPDWPKYYDFMNKQLTELLTKYGPIGAIWFDGVWDQDRNPDFDWQLGPQYELIHNLQPSCLIGNNHHITPYPGEDIQIFERDLPGENKAGLSGQAISRLPLETCETMNGSWGYRMSDQNYKSVETLVRYLVSAAGRDANLLMNVGPQPNGEIPAVSVERLKEMGEWNAKYGETVFGTRGGIIAPQPWGVTTQRDNKLYLHIFNCNDKSLFLPIENLKLKAAVKFEDKAPVAFKQLKEGIVLTFPEIPSGIDYIVELEFKENL